MPTFTLSPTDTSATINQKVSQWGLPSLPNPLPGGSWDPLNPGSWFNPFTGVYNQAQSAVGTANSAKNAVTSVGSFLGWVADHFYMMVLVAFGGALVLAGIFVLAKSELS